jgi:putative acetyltransferase
MGPDGQITVRLARHEDARPIPDVQYDAVHKTAAKDYPPQVLSEWSAPVTQERIQAFLQNPDNELRLVAEINGEIVGFGALVLEQNELRACYVKSSAVRRGVGTMLLGELERQAVSAGTVTLHLASSTTAENFYLANGYKVVKCGEHTLRTGRKMACVKMLKRLAPG